MSNKDDYNILFGAGELFIVPDEIDLEEATEEEIEGALVLVGESSGEAALIIENEFENVRGGKGHQILGTFRTEENISFNAGIITFQMENISKFLAGKYSETETEKIWKLGGDYTVPVNRLRFVHTKQVDGKRIILDMHKAMNQAGLEMNFNATEASAFNLEFVLHKAKNRDNIVTIIEEI